MSQEAEATVPPECVRKLERMASAESDKSADAPVDTWLGALAMTAELETMSILYAKSVLDPNASSQLGPARVAINFGPNVKPPDSSEYRNKKTTDELKAKIKNVGTPKTAIRSSVLCGTKSGPNGSLSSGASDASSASDDEVTRFALSLPNEAVMRKLTIASTVTDRVSVIQMNDERNSEKGPEVPRPSLNCELKPGTSTIQQTNSQKNPSVVSSVVIYRPKVEFRSSRRSKLSASVLSRRSIGALAHNLPPTFRHSIRVNDDGSANDSNATFQMAPKTTWRTTQIAFENRCGVCGTGRIYETIPERTDNQIYINGGCASPVSSSRRSSSDGTADSGQDSTGSLVVSAAGGFFAPALPPRRPNMTSSWTADSSVNHRMDRPGYIRVASCLDQILRAASKLNSALHGARTPDAVGALRFSVVSERGTRELHDRVLAFIQLVRETVCASYFSNSSEFDCVERAICRLNSDAPPALNTRNHFIVACRQMLECSMLILVRIVCKYVNECGCAESLLPIALEHLVQILLFGDDVCLEAVKSGAVDRIMRLMSASSTTPIARRLLLRTLAMLCATARGCLQLLAIDDGLEMIVRTLCATSHNIDDTLSVEAAGVLTQLTRPAHASLSALGDSCVSACIRRLLDLIDAKTRCHAGGGVSSDTYEALLLCSASLANLSLYGSGGESDGTSNAVGNGFSVQSFTAQLLYEHNAPRRLICAVDTIREAYVKQRSGNSPLFVQEQVVTVLSRMANRGYSQALIAQSAVTFLLKIFADCAAAPSSASWQRPGTKATQCQNAEFCRRVCYKAAVCLGMLASTGAGLRALYESRGCGELCEVLRAEAASGSTSPLALICASLKQRLETTYKVESAV